MKTQKEILIITILFLLILPITPIFLSSISNEENVVADGIVSVTFIYFYKDDIKFPNWKNEIKADISNIQEVISQCPELETLHRTYGFLDVESFMHKYTNLKFEWNFYGEVELSEMYKQGMQQGPNYALYHWHNKDSSEVEKIWRSSDIIYGIVQDVYGGAALDNYGFCWLGTRILWNDKMDYSWQRRAQLMLLAHEFTHNFGPSDHYSSTQKHYGYDPNCIMGGYGALDKYAILCDYCLEQCHWDYLSKESKLNIFYLGKTPKEEPLPEPKTPPDYQPPSPPEPQITKPISPLIAIINFIMRLFNKILGR